MPGAEVLELEMGSHGALPSLIADLGELLNLSEPRFPPT